MKQACELVHTSEYNYKKEKNRFKLVDGSDAETPPTPKCPKMDTEELLNDGPDVKRHNCLQGYRYLKMLRTARSNLISNVTTIVYMCHF